jgi:hypothetical protein
MIDDDLLDAVRARSVEAVRARSVELMTALQGLPGIVSLRGRGLLSASRCGRPRRISSPLPPSADSSS